jgi:hypothetical protein
MLKKKQYKKSNGDANKVDEAGGLYLTFCNSPEEMEIDNYRHWLNLSHEERIAEATFLIENIFFAEIKAGLKNPRIIIDRA